MGFPNMMCRSLGSWTLVLLGALAWAGPAAGQLEVSVQEPGGKPVADAVVYAVPLGSNGKPVRSPAPAQIDQVDKEYVPYVTAVRVGTPVSFPNRDQIRHHVYSFSDAKTFEIPLYKGTPAEPILFDTPGVVALGCNIHDWMGAYVFVTDTPHFAVTDDAGRASLPDVSGGEYQVQVWHPRLKGETDSTAQRLRDAGSATFVIEQKRVWRPRRAPGSGGASY